MCIELHLVMYVYCMCCSMYDTYMGAAWYRRCVLVGVNLCFIRMSSLFFLLLLHVAITTHQPMYGRTVPIPTDGRTNYGRTEFFPVARLSVRPYVLL